MRPEPADDYPLAPLQRSLLFHALATPGSPVHVEQCQYRLDGALDPAAFRTAWQAVCRHHAALRTGFDRQQGDPRQRVRPAVEIPLVVADWRDRPAADRAAALARMAEQERQQGFGLTRPPLFRLRLVQYAEHTWRLLWTYHHLILDRRSVGIVLHDLAAAYAAARRGEPATLAPSAPFADVVGWVNGQDPAAAEQHWKGTLAGFTEPTPLGVVRYTTAAAAAHQQHRRRVDDELTTQLRRYAETHGVRLDTLLAGAWAVLLARYSGCDDVVFGMTTDGRHGPLPGLDRTVGLLMNTLPARARLGWDLPAARWLAELDQQLARSRAYAHAPLDRVQAGSALPAGRRLFDSLLSVEEDPAGQPDRLGDVLMAETRTMQQTNYPLTVRVVVGERLELAASFDGGQLDPPLAERMLGHLEQALAGLVAGGPVGDVALLAPAEQAELAGWGAARATFPAGPAELLPARFTSWVDGQPDREAISCGDQRLTYRQLAGRVGRLAHRLRELGVGPGVLVGICLPRSIDLVTAVLAVACAGGGYLPVDRRDPAARVRTILDDASVPVLVTDRDLETQLALPQAGPVPVMLDDPPEQQRLAALPERLPPWSGQPSHVAYVIYTSGSTGTPKGVVVEHAQLARLFDATRQWFPFGPDDVWTLFHSIAFDFSVWELWGALGHGGRLVVVPGELTRDPARFRELLLAEGVTVLNQTPSSFRTLQHADLQASTSPSPYRLRWVIFGGERLEVASLRPWLERYGDQRPQLVNMYGITETTVHVTYRSISRADLTAARDAAGVPSPIGRPIPDLEVRLVDPHGRAVPAGVPGELLVGGAGVARGYLHRPELTAARFVDDPDSPARRWYRSGDRARWLPDGDLEYLGRVDDQVKIRGHRIELGEIESVLTGHPQIRESVVVARPTGVDGHHQLAAYLVPEQDPGPDWEELRRWLSERVPEHLVPAHAVTLDRLPLTSNGKVDRAALPIPGPARAGRSDRVVPRTEVERALAEVWADVLGMEQPGITDNFFMLGGDSILTIQVAARARRRGIAVTPGQLFAHQTIAELAAVATPVTTGDAAEQGEVTGEVLATPVQVWFHRLALRHRGRWHLPVLLLSRPTVPSDQLAAALDALVAHHDLLRLRVTGHERDAVRQHIVPVAEHGAVPVREVDLTSVDRSQLDEQVTALAPEFLDDVDLGTGPLLRAAVFRTPADEPDRLLLVAHHLVVDHVSWQILSEDLETACRQLAQGAPVRLPAKTTDFARWARRVTDYARSAGVAEQADWWLTRVPDRLSTLPADGEPDEPDLEQDSEVVSVALDADTTEALLAAANRAYRTGTEELLLAAFAVAMAGWTGTPRLLVDLEGHGRDLPIEGMDISRTVGWFTTIAPTWLDLTGLDLADPAHVIKAVKEQLRAAPPGAAFGLARWLRDDDLARRLARLPAAQVSFKYLGRLDSAAAADAWFAVAPQPVAGACRPASPRPYRLDVVGGVIDGAFQLHLAFSARHHRRTTMQLLVDAFLAAIRSLLDHCQSPGAGGATVSDFPLAQVTQRQLDQLVERHGVLEDLYPLAPLQRGLLFHTLANPHSGVYFEQFSIRLAGDLDVEAYLGAWTALQERHALLRAGIAWQGLAEPHLVVRRQVALPLTREDWRHLTDGQQRAGLQELLTRDRVQGFDLADAPLTRLYLIRLGPESWQVVWSHHHILLDRWSVALLIQEIFDSYEAIRTGRHAPAPPPRPFRDYLAYLAGLDLSAAPAYWRRVLSGITEPTPLGGDRPAVRAGRREADYARVGRKLSAAESEAVRQFVRTHRLTLDTVLHGAWALVLAHRSGLDDVLFGVTTSGRPVELAGVEEMVGLFINTIPARVRVRRDQPISDWLAELLRDQVRAREFEHTPLEQIRGWSAIPPDQPLFESGRALVNFPWDESRYRTGNLTLGEIRTFEQASHALTFVVVPEDALQLQLWYDAGRFAPAAADHLLGVAETLVLALVDEPRRPVGQVLAQLPAPPSMPALDAPLPELVGYWAAQAPGRTAVVAGDGRLTYRQLNQRADQLAAWLRQRGVRPGTRVGTTLPGTVESVVATLAIIKAGAVWVPLPPTGGEQLGHDLTLVPPGAAATGDGLLVVDPELVDGLPARPPSGDGPAPADPAVVVWWPDPHAPGSAVCATTLNHGELSRPARRHEITVTDVVGHPALHDGDHTARHGASGDVAAWLVWAALGNGACLALLRRGDATAAYDPASSTAPTVLTLTPSELAELLDRDPSTLAGVRLVLLRGDLPAQYGRLLRTAAPTAHVVPALELAAVRVAQQLSQLPLVAEAAVTQTPDGHRLTAYLLPDPDALNRGEADELVRSHLARWHGQSESTDHAGGSAPDRLAEWVRALRPTHVLEINGPDDAANIAPSSADLVVLPLVSRLPTAGYLTRVLDAAVTAAAPDGAVLLGGLRHHGLRQAAQLAAELSRAADLLPTGELRQRVSRALDDDPELQVDPAYLAGYAAGRAAVGAVAVIPRRDGSGSPLEAYRYDALLQLGAPPPEPEPVEWHDWHRDVLSPAEIGWLLDHARGDAVGITHVPHPRMATDVEAARLLARADCPDTVGELRLAAAKAPAGMDPTALHELGAERGWSVAVGWTANRDDGSLNVLFWRGEGSAPLAGHYHLATAGDAGAPAGALTSSPLRGTLAGEVVRQARQRLRQSFPDNADLTIVRVVDELPRTANGRVDEQALVASEPATDPSPAGVDSVNPGSAPVPPRTADELRLARIWEQVLGLSAVDVRTSFFDLGGDSLLAVRIIDETTRAFGKDVPLAVLLQQPTIEGVAAALRAGHTGWDPLVELTGGDGAPFYCVHPAGGNVLCYGDLARLLRPQPFYALQARGVEGDDPPFDDLPAMAARYLQDVRARQATGPYLLGGWSLGGLVAYEMARQLTAAGQRVELLVMMDTPTPELVGDLPDDAAMLARLLEGRIAIDLERLRAMPAADRLGYVLAEAERVHAVPPGMNPERARQLFDVYATHLAAVQRYNPAPLDAPVRLLRAAQTDISVPDYGWQRLITGDLRVLVVPGNHETILWPPNVQQLADVVREQLASVRAAA
jgi:amino acid adenylation domain-containing protein/non-ribosomal peptide synthase protein (TIGR01720 family)